MAYCFEVQLVLEKNIFNVSVNTYLHHLKLFCFCRFKFFLLIVSMIRLLAMINNLIRKEKDLNPLNFVTIMLRFYHTTISTTYHTKIDWCLCILSLSLLKLLRSQSLTKTYLNALDKQSQTLIELIYTKTYSKPNNIKNANIFFSILHIYSSNQTI